MAGVRYLGNSPQYPGVGSGGVAPAGLEIRPPYQPPTGMTDPTNSLNNQYRLYNTGTEQNANDYSDIMNEYRRLLTNSQANPGQPQRFQQASYTPLSAPSELKNYTPQTYTPQSYAQQLTPSRIDPSSFGGAAPANLTVTGRSYVPTEDTVAALANLKRLSDTGGYSEEDINALRARGISPIRSVYANAQRNVDRSRALSGGTGGNYNAVSAKMARELADTIGEQTNRVNAGIAEQVSAGKQAGSSAYGGLAAQIEAARNAVESENMAAKNRVAEINAQRSDAYRSENANRMFDTSRFNADTENQVNLANIGNRMAVDRSNTEGMNDVNRYNTQGINDLNRYNTEGRNRVNEMNWQNINDVNRYNSAGMNETNRYNDQMRRSDFGNNLSAIEGMRSLYGTTPALANLFGNQAMQQAQFQNQINQQNQQLPSWMMNLFH